MTHAGGVLLGVDGGGTHTRALAARENGSVVGTGDAGASNQASVGPAAAAEALRQAIRRALAGAGASPEQVIGACLGLAGIDRPRDRDALRSSLGLLGLHCPMLTVNDAVAAWAGATGGLPGVVVIAGTGSIAYGRDEAGAECRVGGWGAPFGDEGSAYFLGGQGMRAALRHIDGRGPTTALTAALRDHLAVDDPLDLGVGVRSLAGSTGSLTTAIASLAPVVISVAEEGDLVAQAIAQKAVEELLDLAQSCLRQLRLSGSSTTVVARGSVLTTASGRAETLIGRLLGQRLRDVIGVELRPARHPAVVGALILAWQAARGAGPPPDLLERLRLEGMVL